jgi:hypothetical protein
MEESNKNTKANEPLVPYTKTLNIFHSFEEQEAHELKEMAAFSSIEILQHLRQCINLLTFMVLNEQQEILIYG